MRGSGRSPRAVDAARAFLVLACAAAAACGRSPVEVDGICVAAVNVDGVFLTPGSSVVPADSVGAEYLTITRSTGCLDQGEPADPLQPGASNFLDVGTALHLVSGFGPTDRLAYRTDTGEWQTLTGLAGYADITLAVGDELVVPGSVLRVALSRILSDSRCPVGGVCIWAGDVQIEIGLALGSSPTSPHRLHLNRGVGPSAVDFGGHRIALLSVEPVRQEGVQIEPDEYRVRLVVEALGTGG